MSKVLLSPAWRPSTAVSKSFSIWPAPITNGKSAALPPSNSTPSLRPVKSIDHHAVAFLPLDGGEGGALLAQHVEGLVDFGVADFKLRPLDLLGAHVADHDFGVKTSKTAVNSSASVPLASFGSMLG